MPSKYTINGVEHEAANVADLIETLSKQDPLALVIFSKDAEGNSFSPWAGEDEGVSDHYHYDADTTWRGEVVDPDEKDGESEDDEPFYYDAEERERIRTLPKAVVLWPVN